MKFSKPFMIALAALPLAILVPTEAEAAPRCKSYSKVISSPGRNEISTARVCRDNDGYWSFDKLRGTHNARAKLAEHIYEDLWDKGYGILVDYIAPYDDRDRYSDRRHDRDYDRGRYHNYHTARYYGGYPYYKHSNYGQSKKHYKRHYKHHYKNNRTHDHDGKQCSVRH